MNRNSKSKRAKALSSSSKFELFADLFFTLGIVCAHIQGSLRRRGGNIYVDLSLFVLLYNTNFMNKLKFNDFLKLKTKNN